MRSTPVGNPLVCNVGEWGWDCYRSNMRRSITLLAMATMAALPPWSVATARSPEPTPKLHPPAEDVLEPGVLTEADILEPGLLDVDDDTLEFGLLEVSDADLLDLDLLDPFSPPGRLVTGRSWNPEVLEPGVLTEADILEPGLLDVGG